MASHLGFEWQIPKVIVFTVMFKSHIDYADAAAQWDRPRSLIFSLTLIILHRFLFANSKGLKKASRLSIDYSLTW